MHFSVLRPDSGNQNPMPFHSCPLLSMYAPKPTSLNLHPTSFTPTQMMDPDTYTCAHLSLSHPIAHLLLDLHVLAHMIPPLCFQMGPTFTWADTQAPTTHPPACTHTDEVCVPTTPHVAPGTPTATEEEVAKPGAKSNRTFGTEIQAPYQGLRSHMLCKKKTEKN